MVLWSKGSKQVCCGSGSEAVFICCAAEITLHSCGLLPASFAQCYDTQMVQLLDSLQQHAKHGYRISGSCLGILDRRHFYAEHSRSAPVASTKCGCMLRCELERILVLRALPPQCVVWIAYKHAGSGVTWWHAARSTCVHLCGCALSCLHSGLRLALSVFWHRCELRAPRACWV
jgi:hypothetical protein